MTNNMDDFEDDLGLEAEQAAAKKAKGKDFVANLGEAWRTRPMFKLVIIMMAVGVAIAISLGVSSPTTNEPSRLVKAPEMNEAPGGKSSPYFIEQNKAAADQRASQALKQGGSALPTPVGQSVDVGEVEKKDDPLVEFRAETERLKEELRKEKQQTIQQIQQVQAQPQQMQQQVQPQPQQPQQFDDSLAQAMQRQMQQLTEGWKPQSMRVVAGVAAVTGSSAKTETTDGSRSDASQSSYNANGSQSGSNTNGYSNGIWNGFGAQQPATYKDTKTKVDDLNQDKQLVSAGTVNYGQLITEANSDVPGPIMAYIASGPFAGGKAIGAFKVSNDYLVLTFSLVNFKGKDYGVNILALNPNTTLGGMATEVDQRYLARVVLPAAASFAESFGDAIGQADTTTSTTGTTVITTQAGSGVRKGIYSGIGEAGKTVGQFFKDRANKTQPLVRIAAGTPMGLFFQSSVRENAAQAAANGTGQQGQGTMNGLLGGMMGATGTGNTGSIYNMGTNNDASRRINGIPYSTMSGYSTGSTGSTYYGQ